MNLKQVWELIDTTDVSLFEHGNILKQYSCCDKNGADWKQYLEEHLKNHLSNHKDTITKYQRFLLFKNDTRALYMLYWPHHRGEQSLCKYTNMDSLTVESTPIHGHAGEGCWLKVLTGTLLETQYFVPDKKPFAQKCLLKNNQYFISDNIAFHSIKPLQLSVSLHLYDVSNE